MKRKEEEKIQWKTKLSKYFAQGILLSAIFIALSVGWTFLLAFLILIGNVIGLIIGFLILFFLIGLLNATLTEAIWNINMKADWKSLFSHGFVLFVSLIFVDIPAIVINLVMHSLLTIIALFIVYCFIDGYLSKKVAESYEMTDDETEEMTEYEDEALEK